MSRIVIGVGNRDRGDDAAGVAVAEGVAGVETHVVDAGALNLYEHWMAHDTVIVVDAKKEYLSLREARKLDIATIGLLDTESDPDTVDVAIPANDDSIRAIDLILHELADAVAIGKTMTAARQEQPPQRPRRVRSRRPPMARANEGRTRPAEEEKQSPEQKVAAVSQESQTTQQEPTEKGEETVTENP